MNVKQVAINLISEVDKGGYSNIVLNENFKKLNLNRKIICHWNFLWCIEKQNFFGLSYCKKSKRNKKRMD